jgi:hypothetical protein
MFLMYGTQCVEFQLCVKGRRYILYWDKSVWQSVSRTLDPRQRIIIHLRRTDNMSSQNKTQITGSGKSRTSGQIQGVDICCPPG